MRFPQFSFAFSSIFISSLLTDLLIVLLATPEAFGGASRYIGLPFFEFDRVVGLASASDVDV